ncbi:hypothetical protein CPB85DRAFT_1259514 [Mucidula mucida]|nr:hypothetical protein CPB85DRAFT_1500505 [Mucidula mucida]KAF8878708.1 hypothetical protein CPB85DRAFT_1259514 [Mucidula mucida]
MSTMCTVTFNLLASWGFRTSSDTIRTIFGAWVVMHDVGTPLGRRMDTNKKIKFSAAERASLKKILQAIHDQGVLHRDLRSWNIMCNRYGEVSIIDFDRASFKASKEELRQETRRLARFLKGEFVDQDSVIGSLRQLEVGARGETD